MCTHTHTHTHTATTARSAGITVSLIRLMIVHLPIYPDATYLPTCPLLPIYLVRRGYITRRRMEQSQRRSARKRVSRVTERNFVLDHQGIPHLHTTTFQFSYFDSPLHFHHTRSFALIFQSSFQSRSSKRHSFFFNVVWN